MRLPKKIKGVVNPAGMAERRAFVAASGLDPAFLAGRPPRGAGEDDLLDAAVCSLVAERVLRGEAVPHPAEDVRDGFGLRIAIWA
jgi:predicted RNase H-like nuclease